MKSMICLFANGFSPLCVSFQNGQTHFKNLAELWDTLTHQTPNCHHIETSSLIWSANQSIDFYNDGNFDV